jgi:competence protein ComEC
MQRALYAFIGGFLGGVLMRSFFEFDIASLVALVVITAAITLLAPASVRAIGMLLILASLAFVLGVVRTEFAYRAFDAGMVLASGAKVTLLATVAFEPDIRETHTVLVLDVPLDSGTTRVRARVPHYPSVGYGEQVMVTGTVRVPESFDTGTGRVFDYPGFLMKDHIRYDLVRAEIEPTGDSAGNPVIRFLLKEKQNWLSAVSRSIPEPEASLLGGVVVGAKRSLGEEWLQKFRETGIIHIVVLSGYNLTIVAIFIVWLTARLPRAFRFTSGVLGIIAFALMVGGGATVVRASIMAILAIVAQFVDRPYAVIRALVLAGFAMVLWNPFVLAFDPSFQLSFVATLGLILGTPYVERYLAFIPSYAGLRTIVGATLATQIAVLPLLLYQIGQLSIVAPFVNVLIVPLVPFAMAIGFATGVVAMVSVTLAVPLAWVTYLVFSYMFLVVEVFAALPFAAVELPPIPLWSLVLMYGLLALPFFYTKPPAVERVV